MLNRRRLLSQFVGVSALSISGGMTALLAGASQKINRRFTMDLTGGAIGVKANQLEAIELAASHGFESVAPDAGYLSSLDESGREMLVTLLKQKNVVWGAAGLPVDFRNDEQTFQDGLKRLPDLAKGMQLCGVDRVGTWLKPFHEELTYVANFRQHAVRLGQIAKILNDHGQRFGLEYVGPKTLWASKRYSFVHSMAETKELIVESGQPNMGFVLDSWHWYTAHETVEDLRTLKNSDIIACDLNDAPLGLNIDSQIDNQRELPTVTGVIDLKAFLGALVEIGYDGPVRSEPFNARLNAMENEEACAATAAAMKKAFAFVGG